ncbi:MAG: calcineurin-like phosphoesterase C-terminal domain-containing protein [Breznakibacter sp.]
MKDLGFRKISIFALVVLGMLATVGRGYSQSSHSPKQGQLSGTVADETGRPIGGVVVSDGFSVVRTDTRGRYAMPKNPRASFVFISLPGGYEVPTHNGTPLFYAPLDAPAKKQIADFVLTRTANPTDRFVWVAMADPQTGNDEEMDKFSTLIVPDLKQTVTAFGSVPVYGIALGDIVWDNMALFDPFKQHMAGLGIPVFHVIGNHDHDERVVDNDALADSTYKSKMGPTYYSFNRGQVHVVVLDNIVYNTRQNYENTLTKAQLDWLKEDLAYVDKGKLVFVCLHIPTQLPDSVVSLSNRRELYGLLKDYDVHFMSGHTHWNGKRQLTDRMMEHIHGAACGAFWTGDINGDGTPMGYHVYEVDGNRISNWYYKSAGKSPGYQFRVYGPDSTRTHYPDHIMVNVWNRDDTWTVEAIGNGVPSGALPRVTAYDPLAFARMEGPLKPEPHPQAAEPSLTGHIYVYHPQAAAAKIEIRATDRFGKTYTKPYAPHVAVQAHRGGMGLYPENTVAAMKNAVALGADVLEMDLCISADSMVVVSHDPYMNHLFVTKPDGGAVGAGEEKTMRLFGMPYDSIVRFDVGKRGHASFPQQQKIEARIPQVGKLIDDVEADAARRGRTVGYNIEIKSRPQYDNVYTPDFQTMADLCMAALLPKNLGDRLLVQSFDVRTLNYLHGRYPALRLAYLVGDTGKTIEENMSLLSFIPETYAPHFKSVDEELVRKVHGLGMKIVPWTVDEQEDMHRLIGWDVDAIITNYPDRLLEILR